MFFELDTSLSIYLLICFQRKTGGLVVWRSGSIIILYRGVNYKYPYFSDGDQIKSNLENKSEDPSMIDTEQKGNTLSISAVNPLAKSLNNLTHSSLISGVGSPDKVRLQLPGEVQLEEEADRLLDGLGPRFSDWWGYEPLPVDADLLPAIVPGFRKPFRLLPFGVKPKLTDREMTILRRLSRPLPCHFALGLISPFFEHCNEFCFCCLYSLHQVFCRTK